MACMATQAPRMTCIATHEGRNGLALATGQTQGPGRGPVTIRTGPRAQDQWPVVQWTRSQGPCSGPKARDHWTSAQGPGPLDRAQGPGFLEIVGIEGNTMAAFVGHSGAGKSTIINLIPRFYDPQDGLIEIDGQNIKNVSLSSLRKNLSMVSQDIILFDDSIKNNISYAKSQASMDEILQACKFAAAHEFIKKLPDGYETIIGENGIRLSGGQKQRISIARAILKESPIILLDEILAHLDQNNLENLFYELELIKAQIFATGTEKNSFQNWNLNSQSFDLRLTDEGIRCFSS